MAVPTTTPADSAPKSQYVTDSNLQPFLQPTFDPADYLNTALPSLSLSSTPSRAARTVPLTDASSQLQTLLSQLNAQASRLSNTLTQLTDEIIRSGSRLAYEVEVLRGETLGLTDAFEDGLKTDIDLLAPSAPAEGDEAAEEEPTSSDPDFLVRLRMLTEVRARLETVVQTFGAAMQWPVAPSEVSVASSLISVAAPSDTEDGKSREERGKQYVEDLRAELQALLASGAEGTETAAARVEELRTLAEVWKGTAEEKARAKIVENLQKLVDEKQKGAGRGGAGERKAGVSPARGYDLRYGNMDAPKVTGDGGSGYGFLKNLRNLKNEVYID